MSFLDARCPNGWSTSYDRLTDTYKLADVSGAWTILSHDFASALTQDDLVRLCGDIWRAVYDRPAEGRAGRYDVRPNALGGGYRVSRAKPGQVTPDRDWSSCDLRDFAAKMTAQREPVMIGHLFGAPILMSPFADPSPHVAPPVESPPSPVDLPQIPGWQLSFDARSHSYVLIHRASGVWTDFVADPHALTRPLVAGLCSALLDAAAHSSSGGHRLEGGCYDLIRDTSCYTARYTATRRHGVSR